MIILILLLGVLLRVYGFPQNFIFEGELGRELLYIRQYSLLDRLPLIGMTTSHEWLYYGPFYYWVMMPIFKIFNGNPYIVFWTAICAFCIGLFLSYFIVKKIANEKVAIYSTFLQAVSPLLIIQTRLSKLHTFFFILSPILMYALWNLWNGNKRWLFWTGIVFGLMFSFHFSQIPFIVVFVLLFWIKKRFYKFVDWLKFAAGILIPNITYIFQDLKIFVWLPYRAINIADKNPLGTINSVWEYFGSNLFNDKSFWLIGVIIFTAIFVHYIFWQRRKILKNFLPFYLITTIGVMLISNVIHGAFPIHYFLPIFTIVPILYAVYLDKWRWGFLLLILIFVINFKSYFSLNIGNDYVPYGKQLAAIDFILADAKGKEFSVKRVGPFDYFPEEYAQNYKYLILWKGGKLVDSSKNVYTIIDNPDKGEVNVQK